MAPGVWRVLGGVTEAEACAWGAGASVSPACPVLLDLQRRDWASIPEAPLAFSEHLLGIPRPPSISG